MTTNDLSYKNAIQTLTELITTHSSNLDDFKQKLYLDWITTKTQFLQKEGQPIRIPDTKLPNKISFQTYAHLRPHLKRIVDNAYDVLDGQYKRNSSSVAIEDSTLLFRSLFLSSRNVVWVDFGFNIGSEFGGRHPAIILKNMGDVLIVAPISTNTNGVQASDTVITFHPNEFYSMPSLRHRFTNITRITPISLIRVDLDSQIGSVKNIKIQ